MRLHIAVGRYLLHSIGAMAEGSRHLNGFVDLKRNVCAVGRCPASLLNAVGGYYLAEAAGCSKVMSILVVRRKNKTQWYSEKNV